jgi:hypothetical protein
MFSLGLDFPNLPYYIDEEVRKRETRKNLRCSVWDWTSPSCPTTSMRR